MKRILFIHGSADLYGSSKVFLSIIRGIDKRYIEPVILLPYRETLDVKIASLGAAVVIGPIAVLRRQNFNFSGIVRFAIDIFRSIAFIHKLDKLYHFEAVYSNTSAVLSGALYAKLFRKKHIWHLYEVTLKPRFISYTMPRLINMFSDICICVSYAVKNYVCPAGMKESKIKVIYNATDLSTGTERTKTMPVSNVITIGMIGRFNRLKGQEVFVRAASHIVKHGYGFRFLIIGSAFKNESAYLNNINKLIAELQLNDKIKILDFDEDIIRIYDQLDIVAIPSTEPDSCPLVALEAMAMKKPVIASNIGGLPEIVIDGETGILFEPEDHEQLKDAILKLANDAELRKRMGDAGFRRQQLYFTEKVFQEKINSVIASVLSIGN